MAEEQGQTEEEKLAAEWAAMADSAPAPGGEAGAAGQGEGAAEGEPGADGQVGTARVLNQNEIDSLLGFGDDAGGPGETGSLDDRQADPSAPDDGHARPRLHRGGVPHRADTGGQCATD